MALLNIHEFEEEFIVGQYECDLNGRMKAGAMMSQCQAISTDHCNALGLTIEKYRETKTIFLLAKASLEIYGEIRVGDKIKMVTKPTSPVRAVYSRYTRFYNEKGGEVASQDSKWVMVDTQSWRILRDPPEALGFPFDQTLQQEHDFSIPKCRDAEIIGTERVTYSRTDDNGHLNNTQYADIILDNLPLEITTKQPLRKLVINYHSEAKLGESLEILVKECGNGQFYLCGKNVSGKKCFEAAAWFGNPEEKTR